MIDWIEPINDTEAGVDHLGMRVAGENLYAQLLDFTTTVSWRPRYFTFLCWALREAYEAAGGAKGADGAVWNEALRRYDYAIAAASLLADPDAQRIAGSRDIADALEGLGDGDEVHFRGDHLRAANASLAIYAGPMSQLGLVQSAGSVYRPSQVGLVLAERFEASLKCVDASLTIKTAHSMKVSRLRAIGEVCGLSRLTTAATHHCEVADELTALQGRILDWNSFADGTGPSARRIMSIGLLLALHEAPHGDVHLNGFRAALLDVVGGPLQLPSTFSRVGGHWQIYQAHAYVTFALETLLSTALIRGTRLQFLHGDQLTLDTLIADLLHVATTEAPSSPVANWWPMEMGAVCTLVRSGASAVDEPALHAQIIARHRENSSAANTADASALLVVALSRLAALQRADPSAWIGSTSPWRLPPSVLVSRLEEAIASRLPVREFVETTLRELVIKQHVHNALRKLEADPSRFTAKLYVDGSHVSIIGEHRPDMSTPRFDNAVRYLQDLAYLSESDPPTLTPSGSALLASVRATGTP